jgi:hypothetical protein
MMKLGIGIYALTIAALTASNGCQKEEVRKGDAQSCFATAAFTGKADKYEGHVQFVPQEQRYAVVYSVSKTYDSQIYGVVCNLPEEFRQEGKKVKFSGTYRTYDGPAKPYMGGQSFLYLELKSIEAL